LGDRAVGVEDKTDGTAMKSYRGFSPAERLRSLQWLHAESAAGRRQRPTVCESCGQTKGVIETHNEDYSFPFGDHTVILTLQFQLT
jgi:hypothetical protein